MIRPSGRGLALATARVTAAMLSLAILLTSGWAWAAFRSFSTNVQVTHFNPTSPKTSTAVGSGKDQNILLIGDDSRAGATPAELADMGTTDEPGENTDTIMVIHLPADGRAASLMSFPRDALVTPPGASSPVKINSLYEKGGAQLLGDTISELTGLTINHFIKVGMLGFYRISKVIGGIDINMCEAQNASTDRDDFGNGPFTGIDLQQGLNRNVQGKQALAFVRQRHGPGLDDYTRIARQRYYLAAAFAKISRASTLTNPLELNRLLSAVSKSLTVDQSLQGTGLLTLAGQLQPLAASKIELATIPMVGAIGTGLDYQGEEVDFDAVPAFIATFIGLPTAYEAAHAAARSSVTVTVLNGGRPSGSATAASAALDQLGFISSAGDQSVSSPTTLIKYPAGMEAKAKALAAAVPGATPVLTHTVTGVQLVLGADTVHVLGQAVATPSASAPPAAASADATARRQIRNGANTSCIQ